MTTLITGGSGFLGRALLKYRQDDYVVYSRDEYKQDLCRRKFPNVVYVLGDVKDVDRLSDTINRFSVDTIIHTAAIKYIPEAEANVAECMSVNVDGSRNVARVAIACGVGRVVGISTDKAAEPINVYGATKMLMERLWQEYAIIGRTNFTLTRYGNVVGSTGSVIPLFIQQAKKGEVTVTDPDMTRFWLSPSRAVELVQLALDAPNGTMVVPKAQAMTMKDLAEAIAREHKAKVRIIGVRPGEKQHERMLHQYESVKAIDCGDHYLVGKGKREPFVMTSNNPEIWLDAKTMNEYIRDAKTI